MILAACAGEGPVVPDRVTIAPGITLILPEPGDLGRSVEVLQLVTARHGSDSFVFEGRLSIGPDRLLLAGSDAMGRRAMTVSWTRGHVAVERASWLPETLRPENVLADIVLLYWPEAVVRRALRGAELTQTAEGRRIGDAITISWRGEPWRGEAQLRNLAWDYALDIRSAELGP